MRIVVFYLGLAKIGIGLVTFGFFICHRYAIRLQISVAHCRRDWIRVNGVDGGEVPKIELGPNSLYFSQQSTPSPNYLDIKSVDTCAPAVVS